MDRAAMTTLADRLYDDLAVVPTERLDVLEALGRVRWLRSWLDACDGVLRRRLLDASASATDAAEDARNTMRCSRSQSRRNDRRSRAIEKFPAALQCLREGTITGEHVDALAQAWFATETARRAELIDQGDQLVQLAKDMTPEAFRLELRRVVELLRADAGESRSRRQRRETRLRTWTDQTTGMLRLSGAFDPSLAHDLTSCLDKALASRHAQTTPEDCPSDPIAKNDWLRAHALMDLVNNGGMATKAEVVIVVDKNGVSSAPSELTLHDVNEILKTSTTRRTTVTRDETGLVEGPGDMNLGRRSRLPNDAQRRVLHVMYPTCAVPQCPVEFRLCTIHHVIWWRHGGTTDLENLVPLCHEHHRAVHREGWRVVRGPGQQLSVFRSDGTRVDDSPRDGPD
jgi:hypothetical protein